MVIGLYIPVAHENLVRKLLGLSTLQVGVFLLYIALGFLDGGGVPILETAERSYVAALPHVIILTAIVVGISSVALGLALVIRIYRAAGSIEEHELAERLDCP